MINRKTNLRTSSSEWTVSWNPLNKFNKLPRTNAEFEALREWTTTTSGQLTKLIGPVI